MILGFFWVWDKVKRCNADRRNQMATMFKMLIAEMDKTRDFSEKKSEDWNLRIMETLLEQKNFTNKSITVLGSEVINTQKILREHLDQVKQVIAAAMPYMENRELTPQNVVAAFKEMEADNEFNLEQHRKELDALVGGVDLGD